jgi:hypothetical protein
VSGHVDGQTVLHAEELDHSTFLQETKCETAECGNLLPKWCYKLCSITTAAKTSNPTFVSLFSHDFLQNGSFTYVRMKNSNSIIIEHSCASQVLQLAMQNKKYIIKVQFSHAITFSVSRINSASVYFVFVCHNFLDAYLETATPFYNFFLHSS